MPSHFFRISGLSQSNASGNFLKVQEVSVVTYTVWVAPEQSITFWSPRLADISVQEILVLIHCNDPLLLEPAIASCGVRHFLVLCRFSRSGFHRLIENGAP
jgi:hypothetical protein